MKFEVLTPQEVEKIDLASRWLLQETGVFMESRKGLEIFSSAGAKVDFEQKRVRIPAALLERALDSLPQSYRLWSRDGKEEIDLLDGKMRGHNVGGCVRILDSTTLLSRDATRQDLEKATILIDALENIHVCRPVVYPRQFPSQVRDIHTAACMLQYTTKPYGVSAYSVENLSYIIRLASAVAGSFENLKAKPFIWGSICPISPLHYTVSTTDILIKYAEYGLPVAIAPCPISGGTSPVTLAGTLVQSNAEFLVGLVLVQIIRPGNPVKYTTRPIPMDMRTATATFGAIELGLMSAGIVQLARRYGVCSDVYGLGTSAMTFDEQAAFEKSLNAVLPALAGANLVAAAGLLEEALTSSLEQLVIDNEILGMIFRAVRGIEITDETLALDVIARIGPDGDYLTNPHTRQHLRREYHFPRLCYRTGIAGWGDGGYKTIQEAARDRVQAILSERRPAGLESRMVKELEAILEEADQKLGQEP